MLHPTTREMRNESRTVRLKTLPKIPFQKARTRRQFAGGVHQKYKETFPMRVFQFEDINLQCLPQLWRRCQRVSLRVTGFETRITLQLINHVLHPDKATATLKRQSQTRLRNVTSSNMEAMDQLSNTLTFGWQNMIFGFLSRRRNKNCGRGGQQTIGFRQKHVKLEIMNKTVHQPSNYCNCFLSLSCPHAIVSTRVRDFLDD